MPEDIWMVPSCGRLIERRTESSYRWRNDQRGDGPCVILQWSHLGRGWFRLGARVYPVDPGMVFIGLVPEASSYGFPKSAPEPWEFSWLNIDGSAAVWHWKRFRDAHGPVLRLSEGGEAAREFRAIVQATISRGWADGRKASLACYQFLAQWDRELRQPVRLVPGFIRQLIEETARTGRLAGVKELAAEVGWTREHFTRVATLELGEAPATALRRLRAQRAKELRKLTGLPLEEIARYAGFGSKRSLERALRSAV